jgi:predicted DNA-binding transcriptional regulator AlpA
MSFSTYEQLYAQGKVKWCRDHTRRKAAKGEFPKPVVLTRDPRGKPRRIAWVDEEVDAYNATLVADRDAKTRA